MVLSATPAGPYWAKGFFTPGRLRAEVRGQGGSGSPPGPRGGGGGGGAGAGGGGGGGGRGQRGVVSTESDERWLRKVHHPRHSSPPTRPADPPALLLLERLDVVEPAQGVAQRGGGGPASASNTATSAWDATKLGRRGAVSTWPGNTGNTWGPPGNTWTSGPRCSDITGPRGLHSDMDTRYYLRYYNPKILYP